jgi:peroxiredoxin
VPDAHAPVRAGDTAPDFVLPAGDRDGHMSLRDYRGRSPVFLGLFRGLYCAFCRRAVAHLGRLGVQLSPHGIQTLGVVATPPQHVRLYLKHHPVPIILGADPAMTTHAAYGLPKIPKEKWREFRSTRINPTGELPAPLPIPEANEALGQLDLFTPAPTDREDMQRTWNQLHGFFLIDRTGIVRWVFVEAADGLAAMGRYPPEAELVTAARTLSGVT